MGRKKSPGLYNRKGVWHLDKQIFGQRICESTGANTLEEAEKFLAHRVEELRKAVVYGVRPKRVFRQAAEKFLLENQHKASIRVDALCLEILDPFIGNLPLEGVHIGSLQPYIHARKKDGVKCRTINYGLQTVRHILNLAAGEWMDEHGLTWLASPPKIKLLPEQDKRQPYPLSWDEQHRLFKELPDHLAAMSIFAANTGCRDQEVCGLRWEWEIPIPELKNESVFIIPGIRVKNREDRLVVLNKIARSIVDSRRGFHNDFVFTFRGKRICRMMNSAWKRVRAKVGLPQVRVHDLKHTFGRRLRAAGVSFEDRQDLLGHKSGRITTHYSAAEIQSLLIAANKVCVNGNGSSLSVLKLINCAAPAKSPQTTDLLKVMKS